MYEMRFDCRFCQKKNKKNKKKALLNYYKYDKESENLFDIDEKEAERINLKPNYLKKKENQKNILKHNIIIKFIKI